MTSTGITIDGSSAAPRFGPVLIVILASMISTGLVLIAGMLSAAAAFTSGSTIIIPLVASFHGFAEAGESPAMTMTGSWLATVVLMAALATVLSLVIVRISRPSRVQNAGS